MAAETFLFIVVLWLMAEGVWVLRVSWELRRLAERVSQQQRELERLERAVRRWRKG